MHTGRDQAKLESKSDLLMVVYSTCPLDLSASSSLLSGSPPLRLSYTSGTILYRPSANMHQHTMFEWCRDLSTAFSLLCKPNQECKITTRQRKKVMHSLTHTQSRVKVSSSYSSSFCPPATASSSSMTMMMMVTMMTVMSMAPMLAPLPLVVHVCRGMSLSLSLWLIYFSSSEIGLQIYA